MGEIAQGWVPGEENPRDVEFEAGSETRSGKLVITGKLKANSGVDIGDVTINNTASNPVVTSIAEKTLVWVTGTKSAAGDNELIAAPAAGKRIVVVAFVIQNESATATTLILKDGSTSQIRCFGQNQGDGLTMTFPAGREWKLTAAAALNLNLSGANSCGYSVQYYTETA